MLAVLDSIGDVGLCDRSSRVADDRRIRLTFLFFPGKDPAIIMAEAVWENLIPCNAPLVLFIICSLQLGRDRKNVKVRKGKTVFYPYLREKNEQLEKLKKLEKEPLLTPKP